VNARSPCQNIESDIASIVLLKSPNRSHFFIAGHSFSDESVGVARTEDVDKQPSVADAQPTIGTSCSADEQPGIGHASGVEAVEFTDSVRLACDQASGGCAVWW
jgi:hypothetical protein